MELPWWKKPAGFDSVFHPRLSSAELRETSNQDEGGRIGKFRRPLLNQAFRIKYLQQIK